MAGANRISHGEAPIGFSTIRQLSAERHVCRSTINAEWL